MPKSVFEKAKVLVLALLITFSITAPALISPVQAAPTVPSTNYYPYLYDTEFTNPQNPSQCLFYSRTPQNLPDGSWYPNLNFDADWFGTNFAGYDLGNGKVPQGTVTLSAYSYYDMFWNGRGWSNAFIHQGRPPYAGGVYEGHFKAGTRYDNAIPVDGIIYDTRVAEPVGKHYLYIGAKLNYDEFYYGDASNGLLVCFIFQYKFSDGSLSLYDAPADTNNMQSLHVDVFLHRRGQASYIPIPYPQWEATLGDAYNLDIHLQYVHNYQMNVGQWYYFTIDYGKLLNEIKGRLALVCSNYGLPFPDAIILRYIQISAETCGGHISATIDYCSFVTLS